MCRFFDRSTEGYLKSDFDYNSDDRQHDINDRCFELGFIPDSEAFVYPENTDIEIGLKDGSVKVSFTSGNINIITQNANIQASTVSITGNVNITGNLTASGTCTFSGKEFLGHTHSNGNQGSPTGGVL